MTIEEAGELILSQDIWVLCDKCDGSGISDHVAFCEKCDGYRILLHSAAKEAYELLAIQPPPPIIRDGMIVRKVGDVRCTVYKLASAIFVSHDD